jgi:hypothetical protein
LTAQEVGAVREAFLGRREAVQLPSAGHQDWYWEGNVQTAIADHLTANGWTIVFLADTAARAPGDDIRARKGGRTLRVEVKGWPTKGRYADPNRAGEVKPTNPTTQAGHWYSQALLRSIRDLHRHPGDEVAIGLPDWPRFRSLIADTESPLRQLGVGVYLVREGRSVRLLLPHGRRDQPRP